MPILPEKFLTASMRSPGGARLTEVLAHAFAAVEPAAAVRSYLQKNPLPADASIYVLGLGKAACGMANALKGFCSPKDVLVVTKHASVVELPSVKILEGDHPVPSEGSLLAGEHTLNFLKKLTSKDLLLCLISGGGSALMAAPRVPLADLQQLTSALLASGARIDEINILRRHLDQLKGGGIVRAANGAHVMSLILSDVVGDPLEAIASGPTAPDPTTVEDAIDILKKYSLENQIQKSILNALLETPKKDSRLFGGVKNQIIAGNDLALDAVADKASSYGYSIHIHQRGLQGEARVIGRDVAAVFKSQVQHRSRPFLMLAGGETTVTLQGKGKGGRNQETALAAVELLDGLKDVLFLSVATDGEDGPTDAAGAVVSGDSMQRANWLGLRADDFLAENNAYAFFDALGDLIRIGPSGTNVNDLIICAAF